MLIFINQKNIMSSIKNNMYKLPVYIPNYDLTDNKEVKQKTDMNYKYSYVNIDSMYRQTKDIYDYSQYFYLDTNPFIINQNKTELRIKIKSDYNTLFKNYDKIIIENIQPFILNDYFNNLITINNHKAIFNDLPDNLRFSNTNQTYLCTIQFNDITFENDNENINSLFNLKKIFLLNNQYYIKISDKAFYYFNNYDFSNVKVKILFFYAYDIDFNTLEMSSRTNTKFHIILKDKDYLIIKLNNEHNFVANENNEEYSFGGQNISIRRIDNITLGYQDTNYYNYELKEQINNIVDIRIVNSSFPCYINNITSGKNKLYFKIYNSEVVYSIYLNTGYYEADLLENTIKDKIKNIKLSDNKSFDCDIAINENINLFSMKMFMSNIYQYLEIKHVFFIYSDSNPMSINYKECLSFTDIKNCELLNGCFIVCIPSFSEYDDDMSNRYININTNNNYIACYIFNTVIYLPSEYFKELKLCNNIYQHHNIGGEEEYLSDCLCFYLDILKDYDELLLLNKEINTKDKLNLSFTIKVPIKISLLLNYSDSFCGLFGFQDIGLSSSITELQYEITNNTLYTNHATTLNNHVNINPYSYIYCLCDQLNTNNIRSNVKFDLKDSKISIFSIFQIYKQKKGSNYIFNSFINMNNISNKIDYIKELTFYFYKPNGELVDFNGINHSFMLEFKHY